MKSLSVRCGVLLKVLFLMSSVLLWPGHPELLAAGIDCTQARSSLEKRICSNSALFELESKQTQRYRDVLALTSRHESEKLRKSQKRWLEQRNRCDSNTCLSRSYVQRIGELDHQYQQALYAGKEIEVQSVLEQNYDNGASIVIRFNVPVDRNTDFRKYLEISRSGESLPASNWLINEDGFLAVYPFIEPSSKYVVKINPGLKAINGHSHAAYRVYTLNSRHSEPSAVFAGNAQVMSNKLKRALPVVTLNVDEVAVDFFHITVDEIPAWAHFNGNQRRNYYALDDFSKNNPLVYSARFPIKHKRNQRTTTNLDLSGIPALEKSGAYLAVLRIPGRYGHDYDTNFFTTSDIGIQVRQTAKAMHIFSNAISSGQSLEGVEITLYKGRELKARQTTDKEGIRRFRNWFEGSDTLIARKGDNYTVLRLVQPLDLSGIKNATQRHQEMQLFAWGPRDLYRPGELFETYAILRDHDARQQQDTPLRVTLYSATGSQEVNTIVNRDDNGSYHFSYPLTDSAKPGQWRVAYSNPGNDEVLAQYHFSVEEFLPERMALSLYDGDPTQHRLFHDPAQLTIPVDGQYLYGAPASGSSVDGYLLAELDRHPFERWKTYSFGIDDEEIAQPRLKLDKIDLDESGKATWKIDLDNWKSVTSPLALTATASLYESGGRAITRSYSATRMGPEKLVGIEPQFDSFVDNNSNAGFKLILTDNRGEPVSGRYHYVVIREDRNYFWTYSDSAGWSWHYDPMEYESFSGKLTFETNQPLSINVPVKWGNYRLEVRDVTNQILGSYRFRTRWYGWGNSNDDTALKPDQVNMSFREARYQAGEVAHLLLTPATAGLATITVENNDEVLWVSQYDVAAKQTVIDIPIMEDWSRHDIYVTATILSPGDMKHSVAPKRALGFINLPLRRADAEFAVSIDVPEKIAPEQRISAHIKLDSSSGKIADNTYVTLAAVDVGVLNVTRYKTPDPVGYLYGARRYEANYYDVYGQVIENAGFDNSQHRFGGGFKESEAELSRGGDKPKQDVQIVSLQSEPVLVNKDGTATIDMEIPYFNGKLRWMAVAYSAQTYGSAEANTTVADKLVTQLAKPRFLAVGDKSEMTLDLSNMSEEPQQLTLTMQSSGALALDQWEQRLELAAGAKKTLRFPIRALKAGEGIIELQASNTQKDSGAISAKRRWTLGVRHAYPAITRKQVKVLNPREVWQPEVKIDDLVKSSVQGQLILSRQPSIDVASHFEHLLSYPYGCTEQTTSSGYPWVLVDLDVAQQMGLLPIIKHQFNTDYTEAFRKEQIEKAVKRLLPRQNSSGGFALWTGSGSELNWLSVYVADFLTDAKMAGAEVDIEALNRSLNRLREYLRMPARISNQWSSNDEIYTFVTRAYAAYVLAKVSRTNLSDLRRLYNEVKDKYKDSPLAWAHLGYALDKMGDAKRAKEAYANAQEQQFVDRYIGYYDSDLRDLSLTYAILAANTEVHSEMLPRIFELTKKRRWLSTQERNALFKAALASKSDTTEKLLALIKTDSFEQKIDQHKPFRSMLDFNQLKSIESLSSEQDTLYTSLEIVGNYAEIPAVSSKGFTITRDYFDIDGRVIDLNNMKGGDLVVARISVTAQHHTPDALVVDLLPAGLVLENQNLANASVDLSKVVINGVKLKDWRSQANVAHVEYRDDRFVAALVLDEYGTTDLFYLARAVTPGLYRVPPPFIEDMYRPYRHALGRTVETMRISR
jgi:uncharacterized protein YfaS (alpha-2-macroglobulin family)/uncharacterized protein YecT (DUF1311 family)